MRSDGKLYSESSKISIEMVVKRTLEARKGILSQELI